MKPRSITRRAATIADRRQTATRYAITTNTLDDFEPLALENATKSGLSKSPMTNRATAPVARGLNMGKGGDWRAVYYWPIGHVEINVQSRHVEIVHNTPARVVPPSLPLAPVA
jgi:hypothetical protein